jgi:hypothetical protein
MIYPSLCQQTDFGLSCGGCCGLDGEPETIVEQIRVNTDRYRNYLLSHDSMSGYFGRDAPFASLPCEYLIFLDKDCLRIGCAGHPAINRTDYRKKVYHCDYWDKCHNAWSFDKLNDSEKREILERLQKEYRGDPIRLSIDMFKNRVKIIP